MSYAQAMCAMLFWLQWHIYLWTINTTLALSWYNLSKQKICWPIHINLCFCFGDYILIYEFSTICAFYFHFKDMPIILGKLSPGQIN